MKKQSFDDILKFYDYALPPSLIAQAPAKPRDSALLLVYSGANGKISYDKFSNIAKYLPKDAVLVFNQTKVLPARLSVTKPTGGNAEILYISQQDGVIKALSNRRLALGQTIILFNLPAGKAGGRSKSLWFKVTTKKDGFYFLKPNFPVSKIHQILDKYGKTPLPPYIKHSPLTEKQRREQYQTVFAKLGLSVAAPTASLHFTKKLMGNLSRQGIDIKFVRLDVGLGTFAPLNENNLASGKLHREYYNVGTKTLDFLNKAKQQGRPIIAVGTTVVRTLESAAKHQRLIKLQGQTDLFIRENYKFSFVDGIITNFHVPKSSLLMLTSAFVGRKTILDLYQQAINKKFRFFSFGDGMLLL